LVKNKNLENKININIPFGVVKSHSEKIIYKNIRRDYGKDCIIVFIDLFGISGAFSFIYNENIDVLKYNARNHILRKVRADIKRFKDTELNVGDFVRVKMSAISTNVRREVKQGNTKHIVIRWSPIVFEITKKIVSRQPTLERSRYIVKDAEQHRVLFKRNRKASRNTTYPARLYSSDLLQVPNSKNGTNLTLADTYILNKVQPTRNDLQLGDEEIVPLLNQDDEEPDYEPRYWNEEDYAEPDYEPRYWNEEDYAEPTPVRRSTRVRQN